MKPGITIRVVKPPTTSEQLDEYYRSRELVHGGRTEHDPLATKKEKGARARH